MMVDAILMQVIFGDRSDSYFLSSDSQIVVTLKDCGNDENDKEYGSKSTIVSS